MTNQSLSHAVASVPVSSALASGESLTSVFTAGSPIGNLDGAFAGGAAPICASLVRYLANDGDIMAGVYRFAGSRLHWQDGVAWWSGLVDGLPSVSWSKNLRGNLSVSVSLLKDKRVAMVASYDGVAFANITCDTWHDVYLRVEETKDDLHKLFWDSVVNPYVPVDNLQVVVLGKDGVSSVGGRI